jgi:hypothetical protein
MIFGCLASKNQKTFNCFWRLGGSRRNQFRLEPRLIAFPTPLAFCQIVTAALRCFSDLSKGLPWLSIAS